MAFARQTLNILMNDGTEFLNVPVTIADQRRVAEFCAHRKYGAPQDTNNPMAAIIGAFGAYAAASRTGRYTGTFDEFCENAEAIEQGETETVDPTQTGTPPV